MLLADSVVNDLWYPDKALLTVIAGNRGMTANWGDELKEKLATIFKQKTRDEWCAVMEGTE